MFQTKVAGARVPTGRGSIWGQVSRRLVGYVFIAPAVLFLLAASLYPVFQTVQTSFSDIVEGSWVFVGWHQYQAVLADPWFWNSARTTAVFTIASVVLHASVGLGLALLLNERWFSTGLRSFMRGILILPWVFSTAATALMWSLMLHPLGPLSYLAVNVFHASQPITYLATPGLALASIVLVNTWKSYPFYMLIVLGALQAIGGDLYEAAKVDGASAWRRFLHITLPQIRPVLIAVTAIDVITTVGSTDLFIMMTRGGPLRTTEVTAYYIYKSALLDGNLGYGAAMSSLMLAGTAVLVGIYLKVASRGAVGGETEL